MMEGRDLTRDIQKKILYIYAEINNPERPPGVRVIISYRNRRTRSC